MTWQNLSSNELMIIYGVTAEVASLFNWFKRLPDEV